MISTNRSKAQDLTIKLIIPIKPKVKRKFQSIKHGA